MRKNAAKLQPKKHKRLLLDFKGAMVVKSDGMKQRNKKDPPCAVGCYFLAVIRTVIDGTIRISFRTSHNYHMLIVDNSYVATRLSSIVSIYCDDRCREASRKIHKVRITTKTLIVIQRI